jgi:hypothetical protein
MDADDRHTFFGIPYRFDPPSLREVLAAYWQPGVAVVAALAALEERSQPEETADPDAAAEDDDGPVEVLVE